MTIQDSNSFSSTGKPFTDKDLREFLFKDYDKLVRPVAQPNDSVNVTFDLVPISIRDLVSYVHFCRIMMTVHCNAEKVANTCKLYLLRCVNTLCNLNELCYCKSTEKMAGDRNRMSHMPGVLP
ncbi:hypothetical protein CEXT_323411 [Caerostris extrusa]|uniref:Uncharacterized protein n=1 Tax=Caerostris extrusa TaxID=172846 RepID=A0AAV4SEV7_CAEEX|nr:hypothetical protein CEXT_323411 [Caerostris extrusa]